MRNKLIFVIMFMLLLIGNVSAITWRHDGTDTMSLTDDGNLNVLGNVSSSWFKGIYDWVIGSTSSNYLTFNGTQLDFSESYLNTTIGLLGNGTYIKQDGSNSFTGNFDAGNINFSVGTSDFFVDNNNGRVGIGTTSPGNKLQIKTGFNVDGLNIMPDSDTMSAGDYVGLSFYNRLNSDYGTEIRSINKFASGVGEYLRPRLGFFTSSTDWNNRVERVSILDDGNVGIGTTTPQAELHVLGSTVTNDAYDAYATIVTEATDNHIQIISTDTGSWASSFVLTNDATTSGTNRNWWLHHTPDTHPTAPGTLQFRYAETNNTAAIGGDATALTAMTLKEDGNVGIGTASPTSNLHVYDSTAIANTPIVTIHNNDGSGTEGWGLLVKGGANSADSRTLDIQDYSGNSDLVVRGDGNVGIGTTAPTALLEIKGGSSNQLRVTSGNVAWDARFHLDTGGANKDWMLRADGTTSNFIIANVDQGGIPAFSITSTGKVGIGTNSPSANLHVNGTTGDVFKITNSIGDYILNSYTWTTPSSHTIQTGGYLTLNSGYAGAKITLTDGTGSLVVNNGKVGIGTTAPGRNLEIADSAANAEIEFSTWSTTNTHQSGIIFQKSNSNTVDTMLATADGESLGRITVNGVSSDDSPVGAAEINFEQDGAATTNFIPGRIIFKTATDALAHREVMRIDSTGNVGIGTTAPGQPLTVDISAGGNGITTTGSATDGLLRLKGGNNGVSLDFGNDGSPVYSWIQSRDPANYAVNYNLALNPNGGNVGIGTTSPTYKLSVLGTGTSVPIMQVNSTDGVSYMQFHNNITGSSGFNDGLTVGQNGADAYFYNREAGSLYLGTNATARMTILAGGNVGIGTTSPQNTLNVLGDANVTGDLFVNGANITGDYVPYTGATSNLDLGANNFSVDTSVLFVDSSTNNVGIGTTSPGQKLEIETSPGTALRLSDNGSVERYVDIDNNGQYLLHRTSLSGSYLNFITQSADNTWTNPGGKISFSPNNTERMTILNDGNVGIGTTSPTEQLEVSKNTGGNISLYRNDATIGVGEDLGVISFKGLDSVQRTGAKIVATGAANWGGVTYQADTDLEFYTADATSTGLDNPRMVIKNSGNVGIGTTSPEAKLELGLEGSDTPGHIYSAIKFSRSTDNTLAFGIRLDATNKDLHFDREDDSDVWSSMVTFDRSTGNVGIGTTSPTTNLQIDDADGGIIKLTRTTGASSGELGALQFGNVDVDNYLASIRSFQDGATDAARIAFYTEATGSVLSEKMRITSTGNVGIGTTSPDVPLHTYTSTATTDAGVNVLRLEAFSSGNIADGFGPQLSFSVDDGGMSPSVAAKIKGIRDGGDTEGALVFMAGTSGNEEFMRIDNDGNVGIGTTSPTDLLHIKKAGDSIMKIESTGNGNIAILEFSRERLTGEDNVAGAIWTTSDTSTNTGILNIMAQTTNAGPGETGPHIKLTDVSAGSSNSIDFLNDGNDLLRIRGDGNVGIGTTNPLQKLQITGGNLYVNGGRYYVDNTYGFVGNDGVNGFFPTSTMGGVSIKTNSTDRLKILDGGNVGIGTTSPATKLHVEGGTLRVDSAGTDTDYMEIKDYQVQITRSGSGVGLEIETLGSYTGAGGYIDFNPKNVNAMRITSAGNVGIGTIAPQNKLDIEGGAVIGATYSGTNTAPTNGLLVEGNVGIGTVSPNGILDVFGSGANLTISDNVATRAIGDEFSGINFWSTENSLAGGEKVYARIVPIAEISTAEVIGLSFWTNEYNGGADLISERMRITGAGNVGIGNTAPASRLDVRDGSFALSDTDVAHGMTASGFGWSTNDYGYFAPISATDGGLGIWAGSDNDSSAFALKAVIGDNNPTDTTPAINIVAGKRDPGGTSWTILSDLETVFKLTNYNANLITVLGSGNVGIGTASPLNVLTVAGEPTTLPLFVIRNTAANAANDVYMGYNRDGSTGSDGWSTGIDSTNNAFYISEDADTIANSVRLAILSGGNVGIGTIAPQNKLDIEGGAVIGATYSGTNTAPTNGLLVEGNVGIGTTSPASHLEVEGTGTQKIIIDSIGGGGNSELEMSPHTGTDFKIVVRDTSGTARTDFLMGSSEKITILPSGNVGIGTTSPGNTLHLDGGANTIMRVDAINDAGVELYENGTRNVSIFWDGSDDVFRIANRHNGSISFTTNRDDDEQQALFIEGTNGYVGIGTTSPQNTLNVLGDANVTGDLFVNGANITGDYVPYTGATSNLDLGANNLSVDTSVFFVDKDNDRVGIGTTSPAQKLVVGTGDVANYLTVSDNRAQFGYTSNHVFIGSSASKDIKFYTTGVTAGDVRMTILSAGNVGIGTESPSEKLEINGDLLLNDQTNNPVINLARADITIGQIKGDYHTTYGELRFYTLKSGVGLTEQMVIDNAGNVGIGTTSPSYSLDVNGTVRTQILRLNSVASTVGIELDGSDEYQFGSGGVFPASYKWRTNAGSTKYVQLQNDGDFIVNDGNVGIGTTSPGEQLDVSGSGVQTIRVQSTDNYAYLDIDGGRASDKSWLIGSGISNQGDFEIRENSVGTYLTIKPTTGNVGIGTTSPGAKLDIKGTGSTTGLTFRTTDSSANENFFIMDGGRVGTRYYPLTIGMTSAETPVTGARLQVVGTSGTVLINSAGSVGIGTTSPETKLDLRSTGVNALQIATSDYVLNTAGTRMRVEFGATTGNTFTKIQTGDVGAASASNLVLQTESGNVGIGTTSPNAKLEVNYDSTHSILLGSIGTPTASKWAMKHSFTNNVATIQNIQTGVDYGDISLNPSGGNVGIGTTSPQNTLNVLGDGNFTGDLFVNGANITGDYVPYTGATSNLDLGVNNLSVNTNTLFVDSNAGNVGIGTTSPTSLLDVGHGSYVNEVNLSGVMFVNSTSGNVGIGTDNPTSLLYLNSSGDVELILKADSDNSGEDDNPLIRFKQDGTVIHGMIGMVGSNGWPTGVTDNDFVVGVTSSNGNEDFHILNQNTVALTIDISNQVGIGTTTPTSLLDVGMGSYVNEINLSNTMFVNSTSGNVGIGTASPGEELHIESSNPRIQLSDTSGGSDDWHLINSNGDFYIQDNTDARNDFKISGADGAVIFNGGGNVGIGTVAPEEKLHVESGGASLLQTQWERTSAGSGTSPVFDMNFQNGANGIARMAVREGGNTDSGEFGFYTKVNGGSLLERMTIKQTGNVGIGTTTPDTLLELSKDAANSLATISAYHDTEATYAGLVLRKADGTEASPALVDDNAILGSLRFKGYDGDEFIDGALITGKIDGTPANNVIPGELIFYTNPGGAGVLERMIINKDGNVGIGTASPSQKLEVNGSILANNVNTTGLTSFFGVGAGASSPDTYLTAIGYGAGDSSGGAYSTLIGTQAGFENTQSALTVVGVQAGYQNTGAYGSFLGLQAGYQNTGTYVSGFGAQAGMNNSGTSSSFVGYRSGINNSGDYSSGLGAESLRNNIADSVVAIGYQAGQDNKVPNQFILKNNNVNGIPLIQGNFSSGYLGVHTTTPQNMLNVVGDANVTGDFNVNEAQFFVDAFNYLIGIGTTSPGKLLHIGGDATNQNGEIRFEAGDGDIVDMGITTSDEFYITGGNVGIGTTNPSTTLDVNGSIQSSVNIISGGSIYASGGPIYASTITTFADGDTTPSVSGGNVFKTANTGSTVITSFDNLKQGHQITIIFGDSNTDIASSPLYGNIIAYRNINRTAISTNDVISFASDGSTWFETSFSDNS